MQKRGAAGKPQQIVRYNAQQAALGRLSRTNRASRALSFVDGLEALFIPASGLLGGGRHPINQVRLDRRGFGAPAQSALPLVFMHGQGVEVSAWRRRTGY
jgi:hypothetical protein